jgi:hypothetical protein
MPKQISAVRGFLDMLRLQGEYLRKIWSSVPNPGYHPLFLREKEETLKYMRGKFQDLRCEFMPESEPMIVEEAGRGFKGEELSVEGGAVDDAQKKIESTQSPVK